MIPYLHNAIFKVNNFLESSPSFWIMRSQRSRRRDKGLLGSFRAVWYLTNQRFLLGFAPDSRAAQQKQRRSLQGRSAAVYSQCDIYVGRFSAGFLDLWLRVMLVLSRGYV